MKLEYAYLAEFALAHPDGRVYVIGGGFDRIYVDSVPFKHPHLSLVFKIQFDPSECGVEHLVQVSGTGPATSKLLSNASIAVRPGLDLAMPDIGVSVHSVLNVQGIQITSFGEHLLHLTANGKRLGSVSLQAVNAAGRRPSPLSRPLH